MNVICMFMFIMCVCPSLRICRLWREAIPRSQSRTSHGWHRVSAVAECLIPFIVYGNISKNGVYPSSSKNQKGETYPGGHAWTCLQNWTRINSCAKPGSSWPHVASSQLLGPPSVKLGGSEGNTCGMVMKPCFGMLWYHRSEFLTYTHSPYPTNHPIVSRCLRNPMDPHRSRPSIG